MPENAMDDADEIARFYDRGGDLMRDLLEGSLLCRGGVWHLGDLD
jgi:hypothetical protein